MLLSIGKCVEKIGRLGISLRPPDAYLWPFGLQWEVKGDRHVSDFDSDRDAALGLPDLNVHRQSFPASVTQSLGPFLFELTSEI